VARYKSVEKKTNFLEEDDVFHVCKTDSTLGASHKYSNKNSLIGHEGFVGWSVSKAHISATRWRLFTLTAVALRFCRATKKTPYISRIKRRATTRSLNDLP
jgi:hypothetical protein